VRKASQYSDRIVAFN